MNMKTYCLKWRKNTENLNSKILNSKVFKTKSGGLTMSQNGLTVELKSQDL